MQVSVESGNGLERVLTIQVPDTKVDTEVESKLKSMTSRVKIDGFRPGKVPLNVVKQHYGSQVRGEVIGEIIQTSLQDALKQESLRPASVPQVEPISTGEGQPLEFRAKFEVFPELKLASFEDFKIENIDVKVQDADVDNMIETLRTQSASWNPVTRDSQDKDRVTISFKGLVGGEAFEGGSGEDVHVILGSGSMIPGFEEKLIGVRAGSEASFDTRFPDGYHDASLVGKDAKFEVTITAVEEPVLAEVNDEFATTFGVADGGVAALKVAIRNNLERELKNRLMTSQKNAVMDGLLAANDVAVPASLVDQEADVLTAQETENNHSVDEIRAVAERRVKLGLILSEVVKQSGLNVDTGAVRERIKTMSVDYEDPDEFVRHYYSDQKLLSGVETMMMEEAAVDWVVGQSTVTTVSKSFAEIMAN